MKTKSYCGSCEHYKQIGRRNNVRMVCVDKPTTYDTPIRAEFLYSNPLIKNKNNDCEGYVFNLQHGAFDRLKKRYK